MKRLIIYIATLFFFTCQSYKDEKKLPGDRVYPLKGESISNRKIIENFNEFYDRFNRDMNFQESRIKYPLEGEFFDGKSGETENISYVWTERDSLEYRTINLDTSIYKFERLILEDSLIVERIFIPNSGFQIKAHFKRINSYWFLVYFSLIEA